METRKVGRPKGSGKYEYKQFVMLTPEMSSAIDAACESEGIERADWIRRAIKQALPKGRGRPKKD